MEWTHDDGGRATAGFKGTAYDCVTRAIAIATELPYIYVYDAINDMAQTERPRNRRRSSAKIGVYKPTIRRFDDSWCL